MGAPLTMTNHRQADAALTAPVQQRCRRLRCLRQLQFLQQCPHGGVGASDAVLSCPDASHHHRHDGCDGDGALQLHRSPAQHRYRPIRSRFAALALQMRCQTLPR